MLGVGSFFREGVLAGRNGIEGTRRGFREIRMTGVGFLWLG